jgi:hypothetical protein
MLYCDQMVLLQFFASLRTSASLRQETNVASELQLTVVPVITIGCGDLVLLKYTFLESPQTGTIRRAFGGEPDCLAREIRHACCTLRSLLLPAACKFIFHVCGTTPSVLQQRHHLSDEVDVAILRSPPDSRHDTDGIPKGVGICSNPAMTARSSERGPVSRGLAAYGANGSARGGWPDPVASERAARQMHGLCSKST